MMMMFSFYACYCASWHYYKKKKKIKKYNHRWWVRPINVAHPIYGDYEHLFNEIKDDDQNIFFRYVRIRKETFYHLLQVNMPFLTKVSKRAFSPELRLAIILRYLATGDQILSIALTFRCGESTVRKIIHETCSVIVKILQPIYLCLPTEEEWKTIRLYWFFRKFEFSALRWVI